MAENELWYEKYRPRTFDDYVWVDEHTKALVQEWISQCTIPSMILTGGPGRGKTSLVNLIVASLDLDPGDVLDLKGATDNTAEIVRTKIQEFCELGGWSQSGLRLVVFNEADMLTRVAQNTLRTMMDDYASNIRFLFTCNYPHLLSEPISSSRMIRIEIDKLSYEDYFTRMATVLDAEGIELNDRAVVVIQEIADACYPDLRKALNEMQYSVIGGKLESRRQIKVAAGEWETYVTDLFKSPHDPLREILKMRDMFAMMTPEEMEAVYRFLYENGAELFGSKQVQAIIVLNNGQKVHRQALLPDMILLEVFLRLIALKALKEAG
jgi:DNA polymerase III delta prime subunit